MCVCSVEKAHILWWNGVTLTVYVFGFMCLNLCAMIWEWIFLCPMWPEAMIYSRPTSCFPAQLPLLIVQQSLAWQDHSRSHHTPLCGICFLALPLHHRYWMFFEYLWLYTSLFVCDFTQPIQKFSVPFECVLFVFFNSNNNEWGNADNVMLLPLEYPKWIAYSWYRCVDVFPTGLFVPNMMETSLPRI